MCDASGMEGQVAVAASDADEHDSLAGTGRWNSWGPDTPPTAYAVVVRGATSLALLWQGLWIAAEPSLWPIQQSSVALAVALALPLLAWVAMLAAHVRSSSQVRQWTRVADVGALFVATMALLWSTAASPVHDWGPASNLAVLAAGLPGLLFVLRAAITWVTAVVLAEMLVIASLELGGSSSGLGVETLLYPANALAYGVVTMSARFVLIRDARRADDAAAAAVRAEAERLTAEGVASAVRRQERLLHETVLNTLTAVDRGGLTSTPDMKARLVARCRESARVLRELREQSDLRLDRSSTGQELERDLAGQLEDLFSSGVSLHVDCDRLDAVPAMVYTALRTAVREALSNVIRHAGAQTAWLTVRCTSAGGALRVDVEVRDDGVGFASGEVMPRFGLGAAIGGTLLEVGGTARVDSAPATGTTVRLAWVSATHPGEETPFRPSAAGFAIPVLAVFGFYTAVTIVLTWSDYASAWTALLAFGIFVALAVLISWCSLHGPLQWWAVIVVSCAAPMIYVVQQRAVGEVGGALWVGWASGTIAALFLVVAATGPSWGWLAVVVAWLFIQGDVVGELVSPGTAIILAGALFGRSTRRNAVAAERSRADQLAEQTALAVARESVHRLQRRYGALRESRAVDLLERIAEGTADPDSADVQARAALEERFIRTVIRVDPSIDAVHALATSLAVRARRRGVFLDVDLSGLGAARSTGLADSRSSLARAVECSLPGEVARLTARTEGESVVIRLVAPIASGNRDEMLRLSVPGALVNPRDLSDPGMLWEVRQPMEPSP
jgi:signal transduction histidine kinase